jgi:hypothetical protein
MKKYYNEYNIGSLIAAVGLLLISLTGPISTISVGIFILTILVMSPIMNSI